MNESTNKSCHGNSCREHNKGIMCSVKNCAYHDGERYCTAEMISVEPACGNVTESTDTKCKTYKHEVK